MQRDKERARIKNLSNEQLAEALREVDDRENFHFYITEALARFVEVIPQLRKEVLNF